jgi:hypothetical protein
VTLSASLAFALGPVIQRIIDSLVFTLILTPFEPGDRVSIDGGGTLTVVEVNMLTSHFLSITTGQHIVRRNSDLASCSIANLRRSPNAQFTLAFTVDHRITGAQVSALETRLVEYLRAHALLWKPNATITLSCAAANAVAMEIYVTSQASWMEGSKIYPAHSALVLFIVGALRDMHITYIPNAPPKIDVELHAHAEPARGASAAAAGVAAATAATAAAAAVTPHEGVIDLDTFGDSAPSTPVPEIDGGLRRRVARIDAVAPPATAAPALPRAPPGIRGGLPTVPEDL